MKLFCQSTALKSTSLLSSYLPPLVFTPLVYGGIKKCYRLVLLESDTRSRQNLSEDLSTMCLIEHCLVNCLCVGGEKSICFLSAMTSRPWGERLDLADTDTGTYTHTHSSAKTP